MSSGAPSFARFGPDVPASPVILSVPHAGRYYPPELIELAHVPVERLRPLEDRHVDAVAHAARVGETMLVQNYARAWIDLNRAEHERDPLVDEGAAPIGRGVPATRVRNGLGLIPRRAGYGQDLWRRRLTNAEVTSRLARAYRPFHEALTQIIAATRRHFGVAVLLDVHSMPSIEGAQAARIVLGDRFGRSAAARFVGRAEGEALASGVRVAVNVPYAGGHVLDRHGRPAAGIHAIQLELDRHLYLDARLDEAGPGFSNTVSLLRGIIDALADEALGGLIPLAAQ